MDPTTFDKIVGGGLLAGKKTYLVSAGVVIAAVIAWLTGEIGLKEAIEAMVAGGALATLRSAITKSGQ